MLANLCVMVVVRVSLGVMVMRRNGNAREIVGALILKDRSVSSPSPSFRTARSGSLVMIVALPASVYSRVGTERGDLSMRI
jgi:hypothetical protein